MSTGLAPLAELAPGRRARGASGAGVAEGAEGGLAVGRTGVAQDLLHALCLGEPVQILTDFGKTEQVVRALVVGQEWQRVSTHLSLFYQSVESRARNGHLLDDHCGADQFLLAAHSLSISQSESLAQFPQRDYTSLGQ